jgi:toxin-antitoxin system PIN domain toxin
MRALLDINVLIALLDAEHASHGRAIDWFSGQAHSGWASCPITQNGCLRIMSQPSYPNALPIRAVAARLVEATSTDLHAFWPDDISLLDPDIADLSRVHGPRQVTDAFLLAVAVRHEGRFVTFDARIATESVRGASAKNLLIL